MNIVAAHSGHGSGSFDPITLGPMDRMHRAGRSLHVAEEFYA